MINLNDISKPIAQVVPQADPYFYRKFPSGATMGKADETDVSGRPFVGYRNPGDNATTTDKTRVAPTFDPTIAQPLTHEQYYNPRADSLRKKFHDVMQIRPSEQLDHAIALAVGGSNAEENLRPISSADNQSAGRLELSLAKRLAKGEISYLDAQIEDAKYKGVKAPWLPVDLKKDTNAWDNIKAKLLDVFGPVHDTVDSISRKMDAHQSLFLKLLK